MDVTQCTDVPSSDNGWGTNFAFNHKPDENYTLFLKFADADYFKTFGLQFAAGGPYAKVRYDAGCCYQRNTRCQTGTEITAGSHRKRYSIWVGKLEKNLRSCKRFPTEFFTRRNQSLLLIASDKKDYSFTALKLKGSNLAAIKEQVQKVWDKYFPEYANQTYFLDERIENFYDQEHQLALLYKIFAGIAVFISCLGLYGLVSFMAVQRKKEVGIRKVLGASIAQIIYLFSKEFTVLILVAFAIAAPVAWYMMSNWLAHFVYRIPMRPMIFILAVVISVSIAWFTVGYKSFRAALVNPAKSLKSE